MAVRSPAQWLLDQMSRLFPGSSLWRGVLTLVFMACGAALILMEFSAKRASRARTGESLIERQVREGQRGVDLPIGVNP